MADGAFGSARLGQRLAVIYYAKKKLYKLTSID